jgi:hypothetical protein
VRGHEGWRESRSSEVRKGRAIVQGDRGCIAWATVFSFDWNDGELIRSRFAGTQDNSNKSIILFCCRAMPRQPTPVEGCSGKKRQQNTKTTAGAKLFLRVNAKILW